MLFYIQMRWNIEGRLNFDELWDLEMQEIENSQNLDQSGTVKAQLYKVAAQKRVIGIIDVESIDELDRTAMGRLPMREYLEFEVVWPLRDYLSFAEDVKVHYRV
ncbi:MAG TPA: muconolactone Delta-isomerase family protein [Nostocaceae cyanobacterium]|nr:muconolactone Delta-isomerase family protein [Nostocaceae cyanobacterium]